MIVGIDTRNGERAFEITKRCTHVDFASRAGRRRHGELSHAVCCEGAG
jgi:hypothetical protein